MESGNKNLKETIYTAAAFAASEQVEISNLGVDSEKVLTFLKGCVEEAVITINEKIPRLKSGTTPINVLKGKEDVQTKKKEVYKQSKIQQRRNNKQKTGGTFKEKIRKAFCKISKQLSNEKLFAIGELLNHRVHFLRI